MKIRQHLTEEIAIKAFRRFFGEKPFVFFGTGASCALDARFGMPALRDELVSRMEKESLTGTQRQEWKAVISSLKSGIDLENALNAVSDCDLLRIVTQITGSFVGELDKEYGFKIADGSAKWPATQLIKKLVDALSPSDPILHVLTPNYDLLFEYACDSASIRYTDGFFGGVQRSKSWNAVTRALLENRQVVRGRRRTNDYRPSKHVRLYKVHGSLNYFFHRNDVIQNDAWMWNPPDVAERVIITPGLSKYETLQRYRRDLLQSADTAIDKATHFLFVGYGFNDTHLEEYIKRKLIAQGCLGLIVTRDSNSRIESLLNEAENLWLVCRMEDESTEGCRVFNKRYSDWLTVSGRRLWDVIEFTRVVLEADHGDIHV